NVGTTVCVARGGHLSAEYGNGSQFSHGRPAAHRRTGGDLWTGRRGFAHHRVTGALAPGQPGHPGPLCVTAPDLLSPGRACQPGSSRATGPDAVTRRAAAGTPGSRSDVPIFRPPAHAR